MFRRYHQLSGFLLLASLMFSCQASDGTVRSASELEVQKRVARNEARMGLAYFYFQLQKIAEEQKREVAELSKEFAELFAEEGLGASKYEFGVWGAKEEVSKLWLTANPHKEPLALVNYVYIEELMGRLSLSSSEWRLLAVANIDEDEELDVWAMGLDREIRQLNAD